MKHFAKLLLWTLGIGVVAVVLLSLPRHTAAAAGGGPTVTIDASQLPLPVTGSVTATPAIVPTSINLLQVNGCFVEVLPNGNLSPATGCYQLPEGKLLVVTDVIATVAGGKVGAPCGELISLNPNGSPPSFVYNVYINLDALGIGTRHDTFATGLVFSSIPGVGFGGSSCAPVGGGLSAPGGLELLGYLQ